jgi:hypothetical protein
VSNENDKEVLEDAFNMEEVDERDVVTVREATSDPLYHSWALIDAIQELVAILHAKERVQVMSRFCQSCGADWSYNQCECGLTTES